jgi:hypothetical protein
MRLEYSSTLVSVVMREDFGHEVLQQSLSVNMFLRYDSWATPHHHTFGLR